MMLSVASATRSIICIKLLQSRRSFLQDHSLLRHYGSHLIFIPKVTIERITEKYFYPYSSSGQRITPTTLGKVHHNRLLVWDTWVMQVLLGSRSGSAAGSDNTKGITSKGKGSMKSGKVLYLHGFGLSEYILVALLINITYIHYPSVMPHEIPDDYVTMLSSLHREHSLPYAHSMMSVAFTSRGMFPIKCANHVKTVVSGRLMLNKGCCLTIVDELHLLHELLQLASESKVNWYFEPIWARYIGCKHGRIVAPVEAMTMRKVVNETVEIVKLNTKFIDLLRNVNYACTFETECEICRCSLEGYHWSHCDARASGCFKQVNVGTLRSNCKICDCNSDFYPQSVPCFRWSGVEMEAWSTATGQLLTFQGWSHTPSTSFGRCDIFETNPVKPAPFQSLSFFLRSKGFLDKLHEVDENVLGAKRSSFDTFHNH